MQVTVNHLNFLARYGVATAAAARSGRPWGSRCGGDGFAALDGRVVGRNQILSADDRVPDALSVRGDHRVALRAAAAAAGCWSSRPPRARAAPCCGLLASVLAPAAMPPRDMAFAPFPAAMPPGCRTGWPPAAVAAPVLGTAQRAACGLQGLRFRPVRCRYGCCWSARGVPPSGAVAALVLGTAPRAPLAAGPRPYRARDAADGRSGVRSTPEIDDSIVPCTLNWAIAWPRRKPPPVWCTHPPVGSDPERGLQHVCSRFQPRPPLAFVRRPV